MTTDYTPYIIIDDVTMANIMEWLSQGKTMAEKIYPHLTANFERVVKQVRECSECFTGSQNKPKTKKASIMIQWTGDNLKQVVKFTGKSPKFDEWFKTWEDFENYVHSHNDIFKIFNEDGSHVEIPVGAWIVKTPDGYNVPSKGIFKQKPIWSEEDEKMLKEIITDVKFEGYNNDLQIDSYRKIRWLKSLKDRVQLQNHWKPSDEQIKAIRLARSFVADDFEEHPTLSEILMELEEQLKKLKEE